MKFTREHGARLADPAAEATRVVHDQQIRELQVQVQSLLSMPGRFLGRTVIASTGTYIPRKGTRRIVMWWVGGGGGGGGATPGPGVAAAAGGSSGVWRCVEIVSQDGRDLSGGPAIPGAGGAGGLSTGGNGGNGGQSSIVISGKTYIAEGGAGGNGHTGAVGNAATSPNAPVVDTSQPGTFGNHNGMRGYVDDGNAWGSGSGGATLWGAGGLEVSGTTAGNPGRGMGVGGGGAAAQAAGRAGGDGAPGGFDIWEFS